MPKNKLIYYGILIIAATALLGLGYYVIDKAKPLIIGLAILGIVMVIVGMVMESKKVKDGEEPGPENPHV